MKIKLTPFGRFTKVPVLENVRQQMVAKCYNYFRCGNLILRQEEISDFYKT